MNIFYTYYGSMLLLIPPFLLSLIAQVWVQSTFAKYSKVPNSRGITGAQAAKMLMQLNGIAGVRIESIGGALTDHYDPSSKRLRLSEPVYGKTSIAAVGVSAHEMGHAMQHQFGYAPLVLRSTLVPLANIGASIGPYLVLIGLVVSSVSYLIKIGIILFSLAVAFYLVTLPVEFNASRRALQNLEQNNILTADEMVGARKVLTAAAMTYVASALTAMVSLLRLVLISQNRRR